MIVDTSALVAIVGREPERDGFIRIVARSDSPRMSAASYLETAIVIDGRADPVVSRELDRFVTDLDLTITPVTAEQARVARAAYRDFGRGSGHPARLTFGDCFSYALAVTEDEALLWKGDDFGHTDVRRAVPAAGGAQPPME